MVNEPRSSSQLQATVERRRSIQMKMRIRVVVALSLFLFWGIAALTGFLLYIAPAGPRSGRLVLLFLTKSEWGDVHFWTSIIAGIVTLIHVAIDWKALRACVRFLVSTERGQAPRCE